MSTVRLLFSVLIFFTFGAFIANGQKDMKNFISATNSDGSAFGKGIYFTAYDSGRQLIHGVGLSGMLYTFDSNTLVLQNTTNLRQLTLSSFIFSNLNIPVGLQIKTGSSPRLIAAFTVTSSGTNIVHTVMINPNSMNPIAVISGTSPTQLIPSTLDRTVFDPVNSNYIHMFQQATNAIRYYIFRTSSDSFVLTRTATDPFGGSLSIAGNKPTDMGEIKPYFDGKKFVTYECYVQDGSNLVVQYIKNNLGNDIQNQISTNSLISLSTLGRKLNNPSFSIPPSYVPSATSSQLFGTFSEELVLTKSFTIGPSGSSYILLLSITPGNGNFIVQMAAGDVFEGNTVITPKSVTQFATQTTFTQIEVDEDAYPGNNTRVFFLTTSTGRVFKYRFRDNGGQLDIESTPVTNENVVAAGISFTDQIFLPSEKRLFVSSGSEIPGDVSKLYIVPFADCGSKTTCSSCIAMNDPYCGWCVLDGKCSYNSSCSSSNLQNGWLKTPGTNQCPSVSNVVNPNPQQIGSGSLSTSLSLLTVPPSATYTCKYTRENGQILTQSMTGTTSSAVCTPPTISAPLFHGVYESISLSVVYDQSGKNVVLGNAPSPITVYNCGYSTTCSQCVSNTFGCKWASEQNLCVDSSVNLSTQMSASNSGSCPSVTSDQIALVSQNTTTTLTIQGTNLPPAGSLQYSCVFSTGDTTVGTRINSAGITCTSPLVVSDSPLVRVNVEVKYGAYTLPHSSQMVVSFYDCSYFGNVCF